MHEYCFRVEGSIVNKMIILVHYTKKVAVLMKNLNLVLWRLDEST